MDPARALVETSFDVTELTFASVGRPERGLFAPASFLVQQAVGPSAPLERFLAVAMQRESERSLATLLDVGASLASTAGSGMTLLHGAAQLGSEMPSARVGRKAVPLPLPLPSRSSTRSSYGS